jgi:hypothetical protein
MRLRAALPAASLAVLAVGGCATAHPAAPAAQASSPAFTHAAGRPAPSAEVIAVRMHLLHVTAYTAATDPNHLLGRQGSYTSKVNWRHGSSDESNSIEVFPDRASLAKRYRLMQALQGTMLGDGYDYTDRTVLLRLGTAYTPAQARRLDAAFRRAVTS